MPGSGNICSSEVIEDNIANPCLLLWFPTLRIKPLGYSALEDNGQYRVTLFDSKIKTLAYSR